MNYFTKRNSRIVTILLVAAMLMTMLTGCFGSKDPDPTDDTQGNVPPGLVDVKPTETEPEPTETEAKDTNTAVVTGDQVAVRSSPSTNSKPIGYLDKGTEVEIIRTATSLGIQWALTRTGWVAAEYLDFNFEPEFESNDPTEEATEPGTTNEPSGTTSIKGVIAVAELNIRKEPTKDSERVGSYYRGDVITIQEVRNGWGRTSKGWVSMEHVETDGQDVSIEGANNNQNNNNTNNNTTNTNNANIKAVVTATELNIREENNTTSDRVGAYVYGDRITILEVKNGWGRTNKGWISLSYVYQDGDTGTNTAKGIVTGTQLNVRSGPGTEYDKVDSLNYGNRVYILEQITIGATTWACTEDGWISMAYIYVDGTEGDGAGTGVVTGDQVNIRSGPGTGYQSVGSVNTNDTVKIYAQFEIGDMVWGCTDKGWIAMQFVTMG